VGHCLQICVLGIVLFRYITLKKLTSNDERPNPFAFKSTALSAYIFWQYTPSTIVVIMGILWGMVDESIRQMEPFYPLSRPGGIKTAKGSQISELLSSDYTAVWTYIIPLAAVLNDHETGALSGVIHILAFSALPTLQSGLWEVIINGDIMDVNVQYARVWTSIAVQICLICSATILLTILN